jgi:hypothetical protein
MCDASDIAVGAVLGERKDKLLHVIYYASHVLNPAQLNYATTEKELWAKVKGKDILSRSNNIPKSGRKNTFLPLVRSLWSDGCIRDLSNSTREPWK